MLTSTTYTDLDRSYELSCFNQRQKKSENVVSLLKRRFQDKNLSRKDSVMCMLVTPSLRYRQTHLEAFEEFQAHGEHHDVDLTRLADHLEELLTWFAAQQDPTTVDPGQLPFFEYWLICLMLYEHRQHIEALYGNRC
jgi:hypothetical protein